MNKRITRSCSLAILLLGLPAYGAWTEGDNFTGELRWQGAVTHLRNPWLWKTPELEPLQLRQQDGTQDGDQLRFPGLLPASAMLLGKIKTTLPTGQAGLAPVVSFDLPAQNMSWQGEGKMHLSVPVSDTATARPAGQLTLTVRIGALLQATSNGQPLVASLFGAGGTDQGLPPEAQAIGRDELVVTLQNMMGADAPSWLQGLSSSASVVARPVSDLRNVDYWRLDAVYGAQIVAGSGELRVDAASLPTSWQASLPVQISYN